MVAGPELGRGRLQRYGFVFGTHDLSAKTIHVPGRQDSRMEHLEASWRRPTSPSSPPRAGVEHREISQARLLGPGSQSLAHSWLTFAGGVGLEQTRACTDAAFEAGINFFDTANVYGRGAAKSAWGRSWLAARGTR